MWKWKIDETLKNIDKHGSIVVDREKKASGVDGVAVQGDAGALEVVGVVIPELGNTAFGLEAERGLHGVDPSDIALALLPASASVIVGGGGAEE